MSDRNVVEFNDINKVDLVVDTLYKGGTKGNYGDDPLFKLFPKASIRSGFIKVYRRDNSKKLAYVILYTNMSELEWPDYLDVETGIFRYYGDNRAAGHALTQTNKGGNKLLEQVFSILNSDTNLEDIPPFFVFKKGDSGRDVQFLGLAAPGNPTISPDKDLVAFWRTIDNNRFQNYESYFTILDTKNTPIKYSWLEDLIYNHERALALAPNVWKEFLKKGRNGIKALKAPRVFKTPNKYEQLQCSEEGNACVSAIREHYKDNPTGFEACAVKIVKMMDNHFGEFNLTRPWRDGGRDAIGEYIISTGNTLANYPLKIDCALEAKCYSENNSVGVRPMSRLISRIRYRQFGVLVTTSYVDSQAYKEVVEDGHPILVITCSDIAYILKANSIDIYKIQEWLNNIDENDKRKDSI